MNQGGNKLTDRVRTDARAAPRVDASAAPGEGRASARLSESRPGPSTRAREAVRAVLSEPLLRNGHMLTLSSALSALIGIAFWTIAARSYSPSVVGRNAAAISAMTLLAGVAQLDLAMALVRFVPGAGRRTRRLVLASYALSATAAGLLAVGFLVVVRSLSPQLQFLASSPWIASCFVLATMASTLFVEQDGVLTGIRRTSWVALENGLFSVLKVGIVLVAASLLPVSGIFVAWALALGFAVVFTNSYLFGHALPRHEREPVVTEQVTAGDIRRWVAADYFGGLWWLAATTAMPLLVIAMAGAEQNAYFSLPWVIAYGFFLFSLNLGQSLVVENACDQGELKAHCRRLIEHGLRVMVPAVALLVVTAPLVLRIFGTDYARNGTTVLRLMALAAIPNIVNATVLSACRAQRRMKTVIALFAVEASLVLLMSVLLLPRIGITGIGVAWVVTESVLAMVFLVRQDLWLPVGGAQGVRTGRLTGFTERGWSAATGSVLRAGGRMRRAVGDRRADDPRPLTGQHLRALQTAAERCGVVPGRESASWSALPTRCETSIAMVDVGGEPARVVKLPRTEPALLELRAECEVLELAWSDPRLAHWRSLLPVAELRTDGRTELAVETVVPGTPLARLLDADPSRRCDALAATLDLAGDLLRATAQPLTLGDEWLSAHVDTPVDLLSGWLAPVARSVWRREAVSRLRAELRDSLRSSCVAVGWSHGNFVPENVLLDDELRVTGLVDWSQARVDGLQALDTALLVVAASARVSRREVGAVVVEGLRDGLVSLDGWPAELCDDLRATADAGNVPERSVLLLVWVGHVLANLAKSPRFRRHPVWFAANVDPVLRELLR